MDFDNLTDDEIAIARFKCDESLLFFTRFWFRILRGSKFILNWHHEDICKNLERVQNYELEFLGINIPPRFSKTELAAVNFIARGIGMNPTGNYLYITASDELRSETSIRIRDIVSHPIFKRMYEVEMKPDQTGKNLWRTKQGGGLKTATIFGQITGFGAGQMIDHTTELEDYIREFEGCIVLDDLNKTDDSESLNANNSKVMRVLGNTVLSRKNSSDTPIINIQQRAGTEDVTSYFNELFDGNPNALTMVYPVIYNGESLWEWKMPMDKIEKLKSHPKTKATFQTQYMQDPRPDFTTLILPESELKRYDIIPTHIIDGKEVMQGWCFAFADTADEGDDNFAMPIMQIVPPRVYVHDAIFDKENLTIQEAQVNGKVREHGISSMVVEINSAGAYFKRRLSETVKSNIYGQFSSKNKMIRIMQNSWLIKEYCYFPKNPTPALYRFINSMCKLTKTSKNDDDAADSMAGAVYHLAIHYGVFDSEG